MVQVDKVREKPPFLKQRLGIKPIKILRNYFPNFSEATISYQKYNRT